MYITMSISYMWVITESIIEYFLWKKIRGDILRGDNIKKSFLGL